MCRLLAAVGCLLFVPSLHAQSTDPLRFIPDKANLVIKVEQPAKFLQSITSLDAFKQELPWSWERWPEYQAAIRAQPTALNLAGYVGHLALRTYVMGPAACVPAAAVAVPALKMAVDGPRSACSRFETFSASRMTRRILPPRIFFMSASV